MVVSVCAVLAAYRFDDFGVRVGSARAGVRVRVRNDGGDNSGTRVRDT